MLLARKWLATTTSPVRPSASPTPSRPSPNSNKSPSWPPPPHILPQVRALFYPAPPAAVDNKFQEALRAVGPARKGLEEELAKAARQPLFAAGLSLTNAQQKFREGVTSS